MLGNRAGVMLWAAALSLCALACNVPGERSFAVESGDGSGSGSGSGSDDGGVDGGTPDGNTDAATDAATDAVPDATPDAGVEICDDEIDNDGDGDIDCEDDDCDCQCDEPPDVPLSSGVRAAFRKSYDVKVGKVIIGANAIGGQTTRCSPDSLECCTETINTLDLFGRLLFCNPLSGGCKGVQLGGGATGGEGWCSDTVCPEDSTKFECQEPSCNAKQFRAQGHAGFVMEQGLPASLEWLTRFVDPRIRVIVAGEGRYHERSRSGGNGECSTPYGSCCDNGNETYSKGGQGGLTAAGRAILKVRFLGKTWLSLLFELKACGALEVEDGIDCAGDPDQAWRLKWFAQAGLRVRTFSDSATLVCVGWGWAKTCFNVPGAFYKAGNATEAETCATVGL